MAMIKIYEFPVVTDGQTTQAPIQIGIVETSIVGGLFYFRGVERV